MHFIYYIKRSIATNSRFNLFGLLTNSTQRICLVARAGLELVTFRSQSRRFPSTPHVDKCTTNISVYITRLQVLHIIYCYRSVIPALLHHLSSHPLPSLHYLRVLCDDDSEVRALTTFLPHCTNLRTLYWERDYVDVNYVVSLSVVSESVEEELWETVVRRCRNLEEVTVGGKYSTVSCDRLVSVMKKLSESEKIQAQKLRRIVRVELYTGKVIEDYTKQVKHLLPALQQ